MSIRDPEITDFKIRLTQIKSAGTIEEARAFVMEASDSLSMVGGLDFLRSLDERDQLVQSAANFYIEGRVRAALDQ